MQVPASFLPEFPARELIVSAVVQRKGVLMRGKCTCATMLTAPTTVAQVAQLRRMAERELVAQMPLQEDCDVVLVPYLDSNSHVKMVSFLARLLT